jgi:hypothetical protein
MGALVVVAGEFQLFFLVVEDLQEQQPGDLLDALRVAVDAGVLAHDVLDGFERWSSTMSLQVWRPRRWS